MWKRLRFEWNTYLSNYTIRKFRMLEMDGIRNCKSNFRNAFNQVFSLVVTMHLKYQSFMQDLHSKGLFHLSHLFKNQYFNSKKNVFRFDGQFLKSLRPSDKYFATRKIFLSHQWLEGISGTNSEICDSLISVKRGNWVCVCKALLCNCMNNSILMKPLLCWVI